MYNSTEYRVYTMRMARYLTEKGFIILRTTQDLRRPDYLNWYFEKTPELEKAVTAYLTLCK